IRHRAWVHGGGAPSEPCPQPGDAGAVSDPGLVLDRDDAKTAEELLLDVVPLVVEGRATKRENGRRHIDELAVGEPLDERLVTRFLHELRHTVHRAVEVPDLPVASVRSAV